MAALLKPYIETSSWFPQLMYKTIVWPGNFNQLLVCKARGISVKQLINNHQ